MSWLEGLAQQDWRMFHSDSEVQIIAEHALAMLKEQEAVEPKKGWFLNDLNIPEEHWYCGKCDEELVGKGKYCANCGQAVKWE